MKLTNFLDITQHFEQFDWNSDFLCPKNNFVLNKLHLAKLIKFSGIAKTGWFYGVCFGTFCSIIGATFN